MLSRLVTSLIFAVAGSSSLLADWKVALHPLLSLIMSMQRLKRSQK